MTIQLRSITADDLPAFHRAMGVPFGLDPTPELAERFFRIAELDRFRAACDGEQIVATFGSYRLQLTVPGSSLPAAGTTVVTVLPTHRRQGILRALITEHLADARARGEPLAALWASESGIYGRFGYGPATERYSMSLDKAFACLREPPCIQGTMQLVDLEQALQLFPPIYDQVAPRRPGMFARTPQWWRYRALNDLEIFRRGATAHRRVLHTRDGRPAGYLIYRTRTESAVGAAEVQVLELIGIDAAAEKALWQFVCGIDLCSTIKYWNQPVDDPLRWWLQQPRRMERKLEDSLWLRVVDVAAALEARRYSCPASLTFRMTDPLCPWNEGTYRLESSSDGTARCCPTGDDAEAALTPFALGSIYLGGTRPSDLARSGLLTATPDAVRQFDALFRWSPVPWCQEVF